MNSIVFSISSLFRASTLVIATALIIAFAPCARAQVTVTATAGTVGPTSYTTLKLACDAINTGTHRGSIKVAITATHSTTTAVINASGTGSASYAAILITPTVTCTINAASSGPIIDLSGANFVTIDGRINQTGSIESLTLNNTSTSGNCLRFINDAKNNLAEYAIVKAQNSSVTGGSVIFSTAASTGNSNNVIDHCDIIEGALGSSANCVYSLGTATSGMLNSNNTISNCNIANYFSSTVASNGILLAAGNDAWTITNNHFYETTSHSFAAGATNTAIQINCAATPAGNNFTVTNNRIGYNSNAGTAGTFYTFVGSAGRFAGITIGAGTTTASSVQGNVISNISLNTSSGGTAVLSGITITGGNVNVGTITGNTIGSSTTNDLLTCTSSSTSALVVGINNSSTGVVSIMNNAIGSLTSKSSTTSLAGNVAGIQTTAGTNTITNNTIGSTTLASNIQSPVVATGGGPQLVAGITSSTSSPITISGNTICNLLQAGTVNSSTISGITHTGTGAATILNNTISKLNGASSNTTVTGTPGICGISCTGAANAPAIFSNTINTLSATLASTVQSNVTGIFYANATTGTATITDNTVYDLRNVSTGTNALAPPIAVGILCGASAVNGTLYNNMISLGNAQTSNTEFTGIMNSATGSGTITAVYNTVNIEGAAGSGALPTSCFHRGDNSTTAVTTPVDVRDNMFNNSRTGGTGKHYAIANEINAAVNGSNWGSDYNVLNAGTNTNVGYWGGNVTFVNWQLENSNDVHSHTNIPLVFTAAATGNLHMNFGTTPNGVESQATTIATITTDFDNDSRPGPTGSVNGGGIAPDAGADEFDGVRDVLPPVISYTALVNACNTGDRTLTATIADAATGVQTAPGITPRIYYCKNGGAYHSQAGTLVSGSWSFNILAADMGGLTSSDVVSYFVIAQDAVSNVSASPAAGLVAASVNSVSTPPTIPNTYTVFTSPTATISGTTSVCAGSSTTITFTGTATDTVHYTVNGSPAAIIIDGTGTATLNTGALAAQTTYSITSVASVGGCSQNIMGQSAVVTVNIQDTWLGTTDGDWNNALNWSCGVPNALIQVMIPTGTPNAPAIAVGASGNSNDLYVDNGATLAIGDNTSTLNVKGNVTNLGVITGGNIILNGSVQQTLSGNGFIDNLTLNNSAGAVITAGAGNTMRLKGTLTLTGGTLTTNSNLTLVSDVAGTGRIAAIPATGADISGNVTSQQYVAGGPDSTRRAMRHLGHPFSAALTLDALQDNIDITGAGGTANGFVHTQTDNPSAFWYDPLTGNNDVLNDIGWTPFTSALPTATSANTWQKYQAIRVLIRGEKGEGLNGYPYFVGDITYDVSGAINKGSFDVPLRKGSAAYNMIGNPYPSPVDIGTVVFNAKAANMVTGGLYWVWNTNAQAKGAYEAVVIGATPTPYFIQSNAGFMVAADHDGAALHFDETDKAAQGSTPLFKTTNTNNFVTLHIYDATGRSWDKLYLRFDENANADKEEDKDGIKPHNSDLDFYSWSTDQKRLNLDVRPFVSGQVIPLGLVTYTKQNLVLKADDLNIPAGGALYLHDKYLQQYVQLQQGTEYAFEVAADTASQGDGRFELNMQDAVVEGVASVQSSNETIHMTITPNPATENASIHFTTSGKQQTSLRVVNVSGIEVVKKDLGTTDLGTISLELEELPSGVYMVELTSGNKTTTQRLVKE